jgi:hypothetical protein
LEYYQYRVVTALDSELARWAGNTDNDLSKRVHHNSLIDNIRILRSTYDRAKKLVPTRSGESADEHSDQCYDRLTSKSEKHDKISYAAVLWAASGLAQAYESESGSTSRHTVVPSSWPHRKTVVLRCERTYKDVEKLLDHYMKAELVPPSRATAMKFLNKIADATLKHGLGAAVKRAK